MSHEHGPHMCYCPTCNYQVEAEENVKCNTLYCPNDGARMRAVETGEYRAQGGVMTRVTETEVLCAKCHYPLTATYNGEVIKCPYCGTINKAITQVTIPTSVIVGFACFIAGALLGPAVRDALTGGSQALSRLAREHIR